MRRTLLATFVALLVAVPAGTAEAAVAAGAAATAGGAGTVVTCGQTLLASTRLANDLVDCPGDGLVIGAANLTVDLAGHTIDGMNAAGSNGVADDGHRGARVENGTIKDFFVSGVHLRNAPDSSVANLRVLRIGAGGVQGDASAGVLVQYSAHSSVTGSTVTNDVAAYQSDGVDVMFSPGTLVARNRLSRNAWDGMFVLESPKSLVVDNKLDHNVNHGLEVNTGSDAIRVTGNHTWANAVNGIVVGALTRAVVSDNILTGNGNAGLVFFDLRDSTISGNTASGNAFGILLTGGQGGSTGNRVLNNGTSRNGLAGVALVGGADGNRVSGNTADANQGPVGQGGGIIVLGSAGNVLVGNVAVNNVAAGIGVFEQAPGDSAGNSRKGNLAAQNGAHGIDVIVGTLDRGGNRAYGNTPAPNCVGVLCSSRPGSWRRG